MSMDLEHRRTELGNGEIVARGTYRSLVAVGPWAAVVYIELPRGHRDAGKNYNDFRPRVNGGLTYGNGRVYGWDYGHAYNSSDIEADIENALRYFRGRAKRGKK